MLSEEDRAAAPFVKTGLRFEVVTLPDVSPTIRNSRMVSHGRTFDPEKDQINRAKHGVSLAFGDLIFEDADHLIIPSVRELDGEERYKVIGTVDERVFTGVFVWRGGLPSFISVRRSNRGEERAYRDAG